MNMDLGKWMNSLLIDWGVKPKIANMFDESIIAVLMIFVAFGLDFIFQAIFVGSMRRYTRKKPHVWNTLLMKRKVVKNFIHLIAGILIYCLLPLAFVHGKKILDVAEKVCGIYIIMMILLTINGFLLMVLDIYQSKDTMKDKPIKGLMQVAQVIVFFIGGIVIIATLVGKSPAGLLTGLGASAAILMLVFKDTILGFVAGIQLSANNMLKIGDWIQLPSGAANGTVEDITINTVKVRNWDNTISTVPPVDLVNSPFQNWRGMEESGGRRVSKNIIIDLNTIKFCTADEVAAYQKDMPLLAGFTPTEDSDAVNIQLYRYYVEAYLRSLPIVNQDCDLIISQLQATQFGVPIMVYFFSKNKAWHEYEIIQSDILGHLMAMVPKFGMKMYQYSE